MSTSDNMYGSVVRSLLEEATNAEELAELDDHESMSN
jgi:hypothetical protein